MISTTRRKILAFLGASPLAAKAVADEATAKAVGMWAHDGRGDMSLGISGISSPPQPAGPETVPFDTRLTRAQEYLDVFGVPDWMEFNLRDAARYVGQLDADIAVKRSWSMAVKIATQRQRNYERSLERIRRSGWLHRGRSTIRKLLGFDWPW